ncbi:MAG: iron-containing alcohol dehydrogenase, partial [Chitinophagales bacterium]|nr:iron-containing alcohol dehydrogenase [Chitinophagales bacterium]
QGNEEKFARMAYALGLKEMDGEAVVKFLFELNSDIGIPLHLRNAGVKEEHLTTLAKLAYEDFAHPNNPKPVSEEDFLNLYRQAF